MLEHGNYHMELVGNILHVYPVGGFNEFGINALHLEIRQIAPRDIAWALIEHPKSSASLTPEAATALCNNYKLMEQHGCRAIGLEVNRLWELTIKKAMGDKVAIPVYYSKEPQELLGSVEAHL